jgi:hypothetical protein
VFGWGCQRTVEALRLDEQMPGSGVGFSPEFACRGVGMGVTILVAKTIARGASAFSLGIPVFCCYSWSALRALWRGSVSLTLWPVPSRCPPQSLRFPLKSLPYDQLSRVCSNLDNGNRRVFAKERFSRKIPASSRAVGSQSVSTLHLGNNATARP